MRDAHKQVKYTDAKIQALPLFLLVQATRFILTVLSHPSSLPFARTAVHMTGDNHTFHILQYRAVAGYATIRATKQDNIFTTVSSTSRNTLASAVRPNRLLCCGWY